MRVISGTARGLKLDTIESMDTRPTTDRVKENIFNLIQFEIMDQRVLDLFSGSGALGIEAASRGAAYVVMVDASRKCADVIKSNIQKARLEHNTQLMVQTADRALDLMQDQEPFHLVFLDPPYGKGFVIPAIEAIIEKRLLDEDGVIVVEHEAGQAYPEKIEDIELIKTKKYGKTAISLYRRMTS